MSSTMVTNYSLVELPSHRARAPRFVERREEHAADIGQAQVGPWHRSAAGAEGAKERAGHPALRAPALDEVQPRQVLVRAEEQHRHVVVGLVALGLDGVEQ